MTYRHLCGVLCAGVILLASGAANAIPVPVLQSRLGGLAYYDPGANLTWLANANVNGAMTWVDANSWADGLTIDGVSGWRLPTTDMSCGVALDCTGSEMGNLFYNVLGGTANTSITTSHNTDYNFFSSVQSASYWSATEYPNPTFMAWYFAMDAGSQSIAAKTSEYYAWAVHSGDVGAATVPEPPTLALLGLGLVGMSLVSRRNKARNS